MDEMQVEAICQDIRDGRVQKMGLNGVNELCELVIDVLRVKSKVTDGVVVSGEDGRVVVDQRNGVV